jgi:uncharacterized protein (UPF0332 family)
MKTTQDDYIKYRFERAWKTFEDAKSLANLKSWNSSMNRLYYSCFYAVLALFSKHNINSRTHSGVKTQLSLKNNNLMAKAGVIHQFTTFFLILTSFVQMFVCSILLCAGRLITPFIRFQLRRGS